LQLDILDAVILGIIEGLTEFLPISSTGHMVIAMPLLGVDAGQPPWSVLLWVSQFGAILAVILYFWRDLWSRTFDPLVRAWTRERIGGSHLSRLIRTLRATWRTHILTKLVVAMIPTVVLALAFKRYLDPLEKMPEAVAAALIVGALVIELIDRRCRRAVPQQLEDVTLRQAFLIGLIQCISMWPGVSRAGATIMGGMALGLTPRVATQFSFYLAIPTMLGAALKTLGDHSLTGADASVVAAGTAVSFVVALVVVAGFMEYVRRYRFTPFVVYRIVLGGVVLVLWWLGWFGR
jgi:undecaprenyl-diphosphatase